MKVAEILSDITNHDRCHDDECEWSVGYTKRNEHEYHDRVEGMLVILIFQN